MKNNSSIRKNITNLLFIIYIILLVAIVIFKFPFRFGSDGIRLISLIPFQGSFDKNGDLLILEILYNVCIFIPLGIYFSLLKPQWSFMKKVSIIILISIIFEVMQFIFAIGRSDLTDILNNTIGGIIGIGVYSWLFQILKEKTSKIINIVMVIFIAIVFYMTVPLFMNSYFRMPPPDYIGSCIEDGYNYI